MSDELSVRPTVLGLLSRQIQSPEATPEDILLPLRALQRMGLTSTDLQVHVERIRAVNEATIDDKSTERNAMLALEMIDGLLPTYGLRWDAAAMAQIYLPRILSEQAMRSGLGGALAPSDLLPPRANVALSEQQVTDLLSIVRHRLTNYEREPQCSDFYRVPKAGLTTRPAALLAIEDRLTFEALASQVAQSLNHALPKAVVWPRADDPQKPYSSFANIPQDWNGKYIVLTDIESYYECIDHVILATFIGAELGRTASYTRALETFLDAVMSSTVGIPQGPPASETFASAYLLTIDRLLVDKKWIFARYADDYLLEADSIVDGRRKLERLEKTLREMGLRLNVSKTKVMRRETYLDNLNKPSQRVEQLRAEIRRSTEVQILQTEDPDELEASLREAGIDDEDVLWDLFYNRTTTIGEVIEGFRESLHPPLVEAYAQYFNETAVALLRRDRLPEDMLSTERDLKECLIVLSSASRKVSLSLVAECLKWFPRLAEHTAHYLKSIADQDADPVRKLVRDWINPPVFETDWVTAWLCNVPESNPELIDKALEGTLRAVVNDSNIGLLTRTGAARALAAGLMLDVESFRRLSSEATPAIRSELFWSRWAAPDRYPRELPAIGDQSTDEDPQL